MGKSKGLRERMWLIVVMLAVGAIFLFSEIAGADPYSEEKENTQPLYGITEFEQNNKRAEEVVDKKNCSIPASVTYSYLEDGTVRIDSIKSFEPNDKRLEGLIDKEYRLIPSSASQGPGFTLDGGMSFTEFDPPKTPAKIEVSGPLADFLGNGLGIYGPVGMMPINDPFAPGTLPSGFYISDQVAFDQFVFAKAEELGYSRAKIQNMSPHELIELVNQIVGDTLEYGGSSSMDLTEMVQLGGGVCTNYAGLFVGVFNTLKTENQNSSNVYANIFNHYHHVFVRITSLSMVDGQLHVAGTYVDPETSDNGGSFDRYSQGTAVDIFEAGFYQMLGYDDLAIAKYEELTASGNPLIQYDGFFGIAALHIQNGESDKAVGFLDEAFKIAKAVPYFHPSALLTLAMAAKGIGAYDLSLDVLHELEGRVLVQVDPHPLTLYILCEAFEVEADIHYKQGKYSEALEDYNKILTYFPESLEHGWLYGKAQLGVGKCFEALERWQEAITAYEKIPEDSIYYLAAQERIEFCLQH